MRENVRAWLVKNEDTIASVRVCMRDGKRLVTVARLAAKDRTPKVSDDKLAVRWVDTWDELEGEIVDVLREHADEGGYDGWRLFGHDETGEQRTTKVGKLERRKPDTDDDDDDTADDPSMARAFTILANTVRDLAGENVRMVRESSKSIGVLTGALAQREEVMSKTITDLSSARANEMAAEAKAFESGVVMDTLLSNLDDVEHESNTPEMAVGILQQLLSKVMGGKAIDWRSMADKVANDPDLQERVMREFAEAQARKAAAAAEAPANGTADV